MHARMDHADVSQQPDGQANMSDSSFSAELDPRGNLTHLELQDPPQALQHDLRGGVGQASTSSPRALMFMESSLEDIPLEGFSSWQSVHTCIREEKRLVRARRAKGGL